MLAYKFNTRISKEGTISLPFEPTLFDTNVEIIILPNIQEKARKEEKDYTAKDFINEFSGCLKNLPKEDINDLQYEYLRKKYHIHLDDVSNQELNESRDKYLAKKYQ